MKLSDYCDKKTFAWTRQEHGKTMRLINYINQNIDVNLYEIADSKNSMAVFNNLKFWLFKFHNKELLDGFQQINANYDRFIHGLIYSLILGITRDNPNTYLLYDILKSYNIIEKIMVYDDGTHQIFTKDYGEIHFIKADSCFSSDSETLKYIHNLGDDAKTDCHEISFYLLQTYEEFRAVTAICKKGLDHNYYHSFILDELDDVIDFTANLIMPKEQFYMLLEVQELNCINYNEYLAEEDKSIKYDESKTIFDLLRNAVYKQYLMENKTKPKKC